jgi:hypothetical protein
MCETCGGSGVISGRVYHERLTDRRISTTSATYPVVMACYWQGDRIACPQCRAGEYGRIVKVEKN